MSWGRCELEKWLLDALVSICLKSSHKTKILVPSRAKTLALALALRLALIALILPLTKHVAGGLPKLKHGP